MKTEVLTESSCENDGEQFPAGRKGIYILLHHLLCIVKEVLSRQASMAARKRKTRLKQTGIGAKQQDQNGLTTSIKGQGQTKIASLS
jgi:hypothetical protein